MHKVALLIATTILFCATQAAAPEASRALATFGPDLATWELTSVTPLGFKDGTYLLSIKARHPMLISPKIALDAAQVRTITFSMKVAAGSPYSGHILFKRDGDFTWSDKRMVEFPCAKDGTLTNYQINMASHPLWQGTITQLRFTPCYIHDYKKAADTHKAVEFGTAFRSNLPPFVWHWAPYGLAKTTNPCAIPVPYPAGNWKVQEFANNLAQINRQARIVFIGDSITDLWEHHPTCDNGAALWKAHYLPLGATNIAISGDKTENTLWQLTDGQILKGLEPNLFVLTIGINNIMRNDSPASIVTGITSIITVLQAAHPDADILLVHILPSALDWDKEGRIMADTSAVNQRLAKLATERVHLLDATPAFRQADGTIDPTNFYDGLHLTEKGFQAWHTLLYPKIKALLPDDAR